MATIDELRARAELIAEEQQIGGNTAERVGDAFDMVADIIEAVAPGDQQAVLYNPQSPNEVQKAQARANIGAQETIPDIADYVKVSAQTFTAAQKQQARENIGAEEAGGAVKNLAGSASDTETLIKAANNPNLQANVHLSGNNIYVNGIAGGIDLDNNGVNIKAGNSGYPNAKVKVNGQEVATKLYVDGKIDDRADPIEVALAAIEAVIPSQASAQNQLADKAFVNSSISSSTANFVGTFNSLAELQAVQNPTNNDYGFVIETDAVGNEYYDRYKYNGQAWLFEYKVESTPFTAAQWAAIQSGITSALVSKLSALPTNAELTTSLNAKADKSDTYTKQEVDAAIAAIDVSSQIAGKADKVANATNGDFAALDANGNLTDSGKKAADFATAAAVAANTSDIAALQEAYAALNQEDIVPIAEADWPLANLQQNTIYRVAGSASYTDYMYNGTTTIPMATYSNSAVVLTEAQTLTDAQKQQAQTNIGIDTSIFYAAKDLFCFDGYINSTGSFVSSTAYKSTPYIPIDIHAGISIKDFVVPASVSSLSFYDKNLSFLAGNAGTSSVNYAAGDIPSGCAYFRLSAAVSNVANCKISHHGSSTYINTAKGFDVDALKRATMRTKVNVEFHARGLYKTNGALDTNSSIGTGYRYTKMMPTMGYRYLYVNTNYGANNYQVLFYDRAMNFLPSASIYLSTAGRYERTIDLSLSEYADVVYFAVNHYGANTEQIATLYNDGNYDDALDALDGMNLIVKNVSKYINYEYGFDPSIHGYYNLNGAFLAESNSYTTGIVAFPKGYQYISYWTNLASSAAAVAFFDSSKAIIRDLTIVGAGESGQTIDISSAAYENVAYIAFSCYGASSADKAFCRLENEDSLNNKISTLEDAALLTTQSNKPLKVLIFGDSITDFANITIANDTTTAYSNRTIASYVKDGQTITYAFWPYLFSKYFSLSDMRNYAKSGASYRDRNPSAGNERQDLSYQITVALNDANNPNNVFPTQGAFYPDIIIFALGTNDGVPNDTYDSAMAKTVRDVDNNYDIPATLANLDRTKFCEAARWAYLTIRNKWPLSQCFCVLPLQRYAWDTTFAFEELRKMAERYGVIVLDGAQKAGIIQDLEKNNALGEFLMDGLHPNEKGQNLLARLIINGIKTNYIQKEYFNS